MVTRNQDQVGVPFVVAQHWSLCEPAPKVEEEEEKAKENASDAGRSK